MDLFEWECGIPGKEGVRLAATPPRQGAGRGRPAGPPPPCNGGRALAMQTAWEGGLYKLHMTFTEEYPSIPPKCTRAAARGAPAKQLSRGADGVRGAVSNGQANSRRRSST